MKANRLINESSPYLQQHAYNPVDWHPWGEEALNKAKEKDYEAILLLGGRAPEFLRNDPKLIKLVQAFDKSKKYIFAICHGIQILVTAGLVKNKNITCYEHVKFEVEACGGTFIGKDEAVKHGRIVTGQTWQSHPEFYRLVFKCLK